MKIDLPLFNGHLQIEDFLDWVMEVERFFDYMSIREDRKVKLVAYKFKGGASAWWEKLQISRTRQGKRPVTSWLKMKRLLKAQFLPPDFEQRLFQQYQECRQGGRSIQAYVDDFIAYLPEMISWRQKINKLQGLLADCVWQYQIRSLCTLYLL